MNEKSRKFEQAMFFSDRLYLLPSVNPYSRIPWCRVYFFYCSNYYHVTLSILFTLILQITVAIPMILQHNSTRARYTSHKPPDEYTNIVTPFRGSKIKCQTKLLQHYYPIISVFRSKQAPWRLSLARLARILIEIYAFRFANRTPRGFDRVAYTDWRRTRLCCI